MSIASKKLFILLTMILAYHRCECTGYDGPKFRFANGTILQNGAEIIFRHGDIGNFPLELYCTIQEPHNLIVRNSAYEVIPTIVVNQTTLRLVVEKPVRGSSGYYCDDTAMIHWVYVSIVVDSPPLVTDFHCKSELVHIYCNWTSQITFNEASLYYVKDGVSFRLCNWEFLSDSNRLFCNWDHTHPTINYARHARMLTFVTNTCNMWGCVNQTFEVDQLAVLKIDAPTELKLLRKTSDSAVLRWREPYWHYYDSAHLLEYKITYMYSGIHQVLMSEIKPDILFDHEAEIELKLPCADTYYEVRVFSKLPAAEGEEFWSDAAVTSFVTDPEPEHSDAVLDPTCEHRRVKITAEIMLYELDKTKSKVTEEQNELRERIRTLKLKAGK